MTDVLKVTTQMELEEVVAKLRLPAGTHLLEMEGCRTWPVKVPGWPAARIAAEIPNEGHAMPSTIDLDGGDIPRPEQYLVLVLRTPVQRERTPCYTLQFALGAHLPAHHVISQVFAAAEELLRA